MNSNLPNPTPNGANVYAPQNQPYTPQPQYSAPSQPLHTYPAEKAKTTKPEKSNSSVKMLVMTFLTAMCLMVFPLFQIPVMGGIDIYATDMMRIASEGVDIPELAVGDMEAFIIESTNESLEDESDPMAQQMVINVRDSLIELVNSYEISFLNLLSAIRTASTILIAAASLTAIAFLIMLFAAAKNMKKLYFILNALILFAVAILSVTTSQVIDLGLGFIGSGIWLALLMLALSCVIPFIKIGKSK